MFDFALYTLFCLLVCICGSLGTDITTFTDAKCEKSFNSLDTVNGYPDGLCTPLKITGNLETFQIAKLDPGCVVTLYGSNDASGLSCSSELKIVGELATCYNSSWIYYSIDNCLPPGSSSVVLPSATRAPSSSSFSTIHTSSSSSSSTANLISASIPSTSPATALPTSDSNHTGPIIGAIIGSVAVCALLIGTLLLCLHRRKTHPTPPPPTPPSYELSQERALIEAARGSIAPPPRAVVQKEMWAHEAAVEIGRNSFVERVELPAHSWTEDKKRGSALIHVHMAR